MAKPILTITSLHNVRHQETVLPEKKRQTVSLSIRRPQTESAQTFFRKRILLVEDSRKEHRQSYDEGDVIYIVLCSSLFLTGIHGWHTKEEETCLTEIGV